MDTLVLISSNFASVTTMLELFLYFNAVIVSFGIYRICKVLAD